jgi:hypothetical protein
MARRRNVELMARDPDAAATLCAALAHGARDEGVLEHAEGYAALLPGAAAGRA